MVPSFHKKSLNTKTMLHMKHRSISIGLLLLAGVLFYTACKKDQDTLAEELTNGRWSVYSMLSDNSELVVFSSQKYHFTLSTTNDVDMKGIFVYEFGPEPNSFHDTLSLVLNNQDSTLGISPCLPWVFACSQPNVMKIRRLHQDTLILDGTDEANIHAIIKAVRE